MTNSAIGERQILPWQTNRMRFIVLLLFRNCRQNEAVRSAQILRSNETEKVIARMIWNVSVLP
ncbi:hypothetical protein HMPREF0908_2065 [Selenomonas flueggei ATCC 43531]|uniref:Uncharacterized protein n=1 Tax=Selenomonas flueggei ATCC 43531 TaxID=638302 RepID=C4V6G5_9FIRM|nr:hypothetical protein HMPREF0908_2065 [Selenomonas flueggei ATCC 43531]